jgi:hypothetical protein
MRAGIVDHTVLIHEPSRNQNDSGAILAAGKTFRNWFPYYSRNVRLWPVVCLVKDHVSEFRVYPQTDRILGIERSALLPLAEAFRFRRLSSVTAN